MSAVVISGGGHWCSGGNVLHSASDLSGWRLLHSLVGPYHVAWSCQQQGWLVINRARNVDLFQSFAAKSTHEAFNVSAGTFPAILLPFAHSFSFL